MIEYFVLGGIMKFLIISFKVRNSLYNFAKILRQYNIPTSTINTPHSISSSCGLSLKVNYQFINKIKFLIANIRPTGFIGLYSLNTLSNYNQIERII